MSDGYLLPENPIVNEELSCTLVWYPDRDEYRRALLGSLTYLSTWIAWERDANKNGRIAAQAWKAALDKTLECWQMGCLETLQSDVAAIKNLLANMVTCCDQITYGPGPTVPPPEFTPGTGDPPTTYGETSISSWEEWTDHVCYNANVYVDYLKQQAETFSDAQATASWTIGLIAGGLALLSFTGIGLPIAFALASTVLFTLLTATAGTFDDVADDIEEARDDIVCAFILGDSLSDAVGNAIGTSSAAWLLLYQFVDYDSASSIIQQGGYDGEYLPSNTDDSCNCDSSDNWYVDDASSSGTFGSNNIITNTVSNTDETAITEFVATMPQCSTRSTRSLIVNLLPLDTPATHDVNTITAYFRVAADFDRNGCTSPFTLTIDANMTSDNDPGCVNPSSLNPIELDSMYVLGNSGLTFDETYLAVWDDLSFSSRGCLALAFRMSDWNFTSCDVTIELLSVNVE